MDFSKLSVLILFLFKQHVDPFEVEDGFALIFVRHLFAKTWGPSKPAVCHPTRDASAWHGTRAQLNHWWHAVLHQYISVHNNNGSSHTGKQELVGLVLTCVSLFVLWICTCTAHLSSFFFLVSQVSQLAQLSLVVLLGPWHPVAVSLNNQMPYLSRPRSESPLFAQVLGIFEGNVFLLN